MPSFAGRKTSPKEFYGYVPFISPASGIRF
jgi:hypothetical protein